VPIPLAYADLEAVAYLGGRTLKELFHAEREGTRVALTDAAGPAPRSRCRASTRTRSASCSSCSSSSVAVMGEHYDVDAFDQPGVEAGKIAAYALMGRKGYEARRAEIQGAVARDDVASSLRRRVEAAPGWFAGGGRILS
jgi:glucose-6-phosphate isomerase